MNKDKKMSDEEYELVKKEFKDRLSKRKKNNE
jgi:hypothetical protein